jgi:hypothetical protein
MGEEGVDGLEFHHEAVINEEIYTPFADLLSAIVDSVCMLPLERDIGMLKFDGECVLVDAF